MQKKLGVSEGFCFSGISLDVLLRDYSSGDASEIPLTCCLKVMSLEVQKSD